MPDNKRNQLYKNLIGSGKVGEAEIGTQDEFNNAIHDEETARKFHKNLLTVFSQDEIGSEDEFVNAIKSDFVEPQRKASVVDGIRQNLQKKGDAAYYSTVTGLPIKEEKERREGGFWDSVVKKREEVKKQTAYKPTEEQLAEFDNAKAMHELQMRAGGEGMANVIDYTKKQRENPFGVGKMALSGGLSGGVVLGRENGVMDAGLQFNPETGKMEQAWQNATGNTYFTETEANRGQKKYRIAVDPAKALKDVMQNIDPGNEAAEAAWSAAEERYAKAERTNHSIGKYGGAMGTVDLGSRLFADRVSRFTTHDLNRLSDTAWENLGAEKQGYIISEMYGIVDTIHPELDEKTKAELANALARQQSDQRMFDLAVKKNMPENVTDYFFRKMANVNLINTLIDAGARWVTNSTGDEEARESAEETYGKKHRVAGIAGTVTGFLLDPLVLLSAGAGSLATKGSMWLGGKMLGGAAMRKLGSTLGGKVLLGSIAGAANLGTYEAGSELADQLKWGGYIDPETGKRVKGFSLGNIGRSALHGALMGSGTGVVAPLIGNVSNKLARATESTIGKLAVRAGELGVSTVAEGTIFSLPQFYTVYNNYATEIGKLSDKNSPYYIEDEKEREAKIEEITKMRDEELMDVWTDNLATMAGFKVQHLVKSAPARIAEVFGEKGNRLAGFETRLRNILNGQPELSLSKDEKDELQRGGYTDLAGLVEDFEGYKTKKAAEAAEKVGTTSAERMLEGETLPEELSTELKNRFTQLMNDQSISEAARAKMYYYITGHYLPMSTVMGVSDVEEVKDGEGNVTGYNVQSFGVNGVITSRTFDSKKRAELERAEINRQVELNGIDVGEKYYSNRSEMRKWYEACRRVADMKGMPSARKLFDLMQQDPETMNEAMKTWTAQVINEYNKLGDDYIAYNADTGEAAFRGEHEYTLLGLRNAINEKYDVDVMDAIRKEPGRRSEAEQKAVEEYAQELFKNAKFGSSANAENTVADEDIAGETSEHGTDNGIKELLESNGGIEDGGEDVEKKSAAWIDGYYTPADERADIYAELVTGGDNPDAEVVDAWQGIVDRIELDAYTNSIMERETANLSRHTDGALHPATLKEINENGENKQVFIVEGTVETDVNGAVIGGSDVVVYDPATGERKMIDPKSDTGILSVDEVVPMKDLEGEIDKHRIEYIDSEMAKAKGVLPFNEGDVYTLTDDEGVQHEVMIGGGDYGDMVAVFADGAEDGTLMSKATVQQMADNTRSVKLAERMEAKKAADELESSLESEEGARSTDDNSTIETSDNSLGTEPNTEAESQDTVSTTEEGSAETEEAMPMKGEEPDFKSVEPERSHRWLYEESGLTREEAGRFVKNNIEAAEKTLEKLNKKKPEIGTNITEYRKKTADWQKKVDDAEDDVKYWNGVKAVQDKVIAAERDALAARNAAAHDAAVEAEKKRIAEEEAKKAEREALGVNNVSPAIREKWENAEKIEGARNEIVLANGEKIPGRYVIVESGIVTPSHNPNSEFAKNEGFPFDENGQSVNDRDYERDKGAQEITRDIARNYDSRALQTPVVVSQDGVVLSGNGRTMAGELAAQDNTDGAYIEYLRNYPEQFGFSKEQIEEYLVTGQGHPRVVFVADEIMPYNAETFAKFNQQDMKGQSKTEQAVKLGKVVDDATFGRIIKSINGFESLADFYRDEKAAPEAIRELQKAGAINNMQMSEMFDGEAISGTGKQMLENMLIGKAFESNPDAIRQLAEYPALRQSVISALAEISNNIKLGENYTLESELAEAINLAYQARKSGYKSGEAVSSFARQLNLFQYDEGETVADYRNASVLMLGDALNDKSNTRLKRVLQVYNNLAEQSAAGQLDIFSGGVKTKEDIINEVKEILNYGTTTEDNLAAKATGKERTTRPSGKDEGTEQNGVTGNGDESDIVAPTVESAGVDAAIAKAEAETNTEPTEAQKEAGNYKKGHLKLDGYDISIENPKGSMRRGKDASGKEWEQEMQNTYGYIRGTEGVDGDHIDVFLSDDPSQGDVFVVDQVNKDGSFDEHKVMYGFPDIESARKAYLSNYEEGWQGLGAITPVSKEEFKKWIDSSHRKTKPFAEYSSVKPLGDTQLGDNIEPGFEPKYTVTPKPYTTKRGKVLDMQLLKFPNELSKEQQRAAASLARELKGWWSKEDNGFMLRSVEDAEQLVKTILDEEAVQDAQPLSVEDMAAVTDHAAVKEADEAIKVEQEPQTTPQYDYDREDEVRDQVLTGLRVALDNRNTGSIPNIKAIENEIRDLRKRAKTIEDGMATAEGETIPQAFDALANLNGRRKAYEQFLVDLRTKMAETERDDALAAHGVKLGDKIMYKGKEVTIHDADQKQVTLDVGLAPVLYEVTDWENVDLPKQEPAAPQPKKVNVESLVGELNEKGEAKLSDHAEEVKDEPKQETTEEPKQEEKKAKNKWVDDADAERFEQLRQRLRKKLGGQLNMGIDPEAFTIGVEMSYLMLKHGARKFAEFAKNMIEALGENVRPYLKTFYNGARDLPEMADIEKDLTPYDEVRTFDVMNFDKEGAKDIIATAEHIVREQAAEREAQEATTQLKAQRNEQRKEIEQQVAADTEATRSEAETVASEVESKLPTARTEQEVNDLAKNVDDALEKVNDQLAVLGYYEAEPVESDFNEAYGYIRNAEKKAVKNVTELYKTLANELGISDPVVYDAKGKKQKAVTANIAPAGGDVTLRFMLNRKKGVELYMDFELEPDYENNRDNLVLKGIMFRPEKNLPNGGRDYLRANNFFPADVTLPMMLQGIRSVCQEWLPAEDYVGMAQRIATEKVREIAEKGKKTTQSKKKSVSLHEQTIPDLFSGLFGEDELNSKDNDTARTDNTKGISREDGSVGSVPADRDGVLDTRSTGGTERGETTGVSDETGAVADGTRTGVPGRRSSGSAEGGDNLASEAGQPLSDGGRSVRDGAASDGRGHDNRAAAATSDGVPSQTGAGSTGGRREQLAERRVRATKQPEPKFTRNYLYPEDASEIDNMTPQQRLKANVEALEIVRTLMQEGRQATAEEREVLGRYRGWGGVELGRAYSTSMMRKSFTDRWGAPTEQGKLLTRLADVIDALDPNGERGVLSAINRAALTSYYTPTGIAKVMNRFAELAGFKGGSMLDPSMGNGVFEGTMSKGVQQRTMIHGIELDWLTGQIARNLYPDANVLVTGYEQAGTADNAYDVVMSNIPFGSISVTDKTWKHDSSPVRKAAQGKIHNYFAVKMLDNTRPGGLCVIMTSNAILDTKGNQIIREHLADQAEVLGVVRLPDNTFKGAGTSVVTDVIFLRKYKDDADRAAIRGNEDYTANIEKPFLSSGELQLTNPTDGKTYKVAVNGYFTKNKGMMIGDAKAGGQYRADEFGLGSSLGTDELANAMSKIVEKKIVGDRKGKLFDTHKTEREVHQAVSEAYKGDGNFISSGNIVEQDGMFGIVTSNKNKYGDVTSTFNEMPSLKAKASRIRAMLPIREAMKELIAAEIGGTKEDVLKELRKKLQGAYDAYVKKFGHLNNKENDFLTEDIDGYTLRSLEKMKDGKFAGLSDIFTKNTIKPALDLSTAKTPQDAISLSLAEYGEINPSFMEDALGASWAEQCGESLFRTPFTEDVYETADAYLSGDVKTKLEQAREAAKQDKAFERNVEALEAVQPKDIPFDEISIRMGARWVPADVYTDFMYDMFGIHKNDWKGNKSGVEYMPEVDQYVVNVANNELGGEADAWRTSRRAASEVFTAALQDKSLSVFDTIKEDGVEKKILNKEETELLNNKIQDLRTAFEDWLSQNPEREEMLMRMYNDKFNRTVLRKFDGSHLNVAGLMGKELRPHQKDAVWMLVNNRGGIVDHIVGAGKTLVMQSAIMEMRRMGIAKKPMIIGLKATVAQIAKEFREAYPAARILAPTEKDFAKENRKKFMSQIALNDYDCVILSHDQYCMLPHTEEVERGVIDEQMMQLDAAIEYLYGQSDKSQLTKKQIKGLEKRKANLEAKLDKLLDRKIDREFTFEGLGVDYLFVDECQHFKSLPYVSTYDRVAGLGDKQGSQRAIALLNGVRYLQRMHQGDRGTVFLSGTTISNSLSEIYHLLNYLRPSEMERLGMTTFDAWAGNYAIHTAELEYGVTNELKEKDRFRSLTNIPELSKMYAEIADVRNDMNLQLPKPKMRSHVVTVPQSDIMQEINAEIVKMVKNKDGMYFGIDSKDTTPWGLLASTLSAKAAINPRLIDEAYDSEGGKIPAVCENVKKIYDQFAGQKGTQLIFCDTGVPGKGKKYDAYSDIINRLVNDYGIPRKEIADIHEAGTDEKRKALFAKVNDGSVRILIGGTKNMGTGVNVQKRIVAMHHVDVPWTPADREQREGRGVRQGNEIARDFNDDNVDVYFYATEGSLDMYKYQLQETKGKLFAQFKSGTIGERTFDEGDAEGDFDPAEVVAMLSGNPVIFEKSKQDKKVEKLRRAKRAYESDWQRRRSRYEELQTKKRNFERLLSLNSSDVRDLERGGFTPDEEGKYPATVTVSIKDDYASRRSFDKPKEAGEYIHSLLKQGKKVQLSGFNQKANVSIPITDAGLFGKPVAELDSYGGIKYSVEVSDDDTAAGVAFRNLLQKVYSNRKVYERNLEEIDNQLKGADPGENKFPKQAELDEALKEKKRLDDEYKKLSDEESKPTSDEDTAKYRIREDAPPTKTGIGYKVFVLKDGKLYPPMVANPNGEATPVGVWLNADAAPVAGVTKTGRQQVKAGGKGTQGGSGTLAYRPGWHLGMIPYALQFNRRGSTGERTDFPKNFVWAEVDYANDRDYQDEAMSYGITKGGKFQHSLAGLPRVPEDGSYTYRTNPNPETDPWVITGAMKVNRILKPSEVDAIVKAAGRKPQPRQKGALTDADVERLNEGFRNDIAAQETSKVEAVNDMGKKLGLSIRIVKDTNEISDKDGKKQRKMRKSKGWFNPKTGEIVVVIPNNVDVNDAVATVLHEAVTHKGLRELFGKDYDTFLDNVFNNVDKPIREKIVEKAGKKNWDFRTATEEYMAELAESTDFDKEENRSVWRMIKDFFMDMLRKVGIKLLKPLTDNELRYILWRSYERLSKHGTIVSRTGRRENESSLESEEDARSEELLHRDDDEENPVAEISDEEWEKAGAGKLSFEESVLKGVLELTARNKQDLETRVLAMKSIGGNLSKLRSAMARQREYDKQTVYQIVNLSKMLIDAGMIDNLTRGEVKKLLGLVAGAAGKEEITTSAKAVADMLIRRMLVNSKELLNKMLQVKGEKVNAKGVEVQGKLDIEGQRMLEAMKEGKVLSPETLEKRIADVQDKMGDSEHEGLANEAAVEYEGLMLAKQYHDTIKASEDEEYDLKQAIKDAKAKVKEEGYEQYGGRESFKEYIKACEDAIRENQLERLEAYTELQARLGSGLSKSVAKAKEWREQDLKRKQEIYHNANSDLEGVSASEHATPTRLEKMLNHNVMRFFLKPLANFDYLLRFLGKKSVDGKGYLFNRFMGGWSKATDKEQRNLLKANEELADKVSEVMGKKMRWSDLFAMERKMPKLEVEIWDAGEKRTYELTQGNMLYIYMVNKMADGKMKLRNMGITEDDVDYITEHIDPRFIELADWVQDEYLTKKREEYNEVYKRMFGADMASIDNYFPLKINSRSRGQDVDLEDGMFQTNKNLGSIYTGSIIKRKRNALPLDITNADAFDVLLEHIEKMEHWAAFAEFNRDLNTLLSYKRFRNKLMNMSSVRFGSGKRLLDNFIQACSVATGAYRPKIDKDGADATLVNVAKGVTQAKISFRMYTALKQFLSYPAYLSEANPIELAKYTNPVGAAVAWKWAMDELPGFAKRWKSRIAGDSRLQQTDVDWGYWHKKFVEKAGRLGMMPNAWVDAVTVAMGAKAIYETKLKQYKKDGFSDEKAKEKALHDASISFNETQQSSENAFLSAMQLDRTVASVALTVFRNASMGYQRRAMSAMSNLKKAMKPGYKEESIEFMRKQFIREGLTEEQAEKAAKRAYWRSWRKNIADVLIFNYVIQVAWNLGSYMMYLMFGDDDKKKWEMLEDALLHGLAGGIEGLSGGSTMSEIYNLWRSGEDISRYNFNLLPLMSDLQTILRHYKSDEVLALNDVVNLIIQSGFGVNPQTISDGVVAMGDYFGAEEDEKTSKELALLLMRIGQVPQKQLEELYIDELGMTAGAAKKLDIERLAQRYAEYKRKKGAPITGWLYDDEEKAKAEQRAMKRFMESVNSRVENMDEAELEDNFDVDDMLRKKIIGKEIGKRRGVEDTDGNKPASNWKDETKKAHLEYQKHRNYFDIAEDMLLKSEKKKAEEEGDTERVKQLNYANEQIKSLKALLGYVPYVAEDGSEVKAEDVMGWIRELRSEVMEEFGLKAQR